MSKTTTGEPPASGRGYRQASQMDAVAALEERAAELERQLQALTTTNGQASGPVAARTAEGGVDGPPGIRYAYEPLSGGTVPEGTAEGSADQPAPGAGGGDDGERERRREQQQHDAVLGEGRPGHAPGVRRRALPGRHADI